MTTDTGGSAFPRLGLKVMEPNGTIVPHEPGLTVRDYFAAKASEEDVKAYREGPITDHIVEGSDGRKHIVKKNAVYTREQAKYRYADAMLKARKQ